MKLKLLTIDVEVVVDEKPLQDDAFEMWVFHSKENSSNAAVSAFYVKDGIRNGAQYLHLEFVDLDSGEIQVMNASCGMHNAMFRNKLYPEIMLKPIEDYYIENNIQFYSFTFGNIKTRTYGSYNKQATHPVH